MFIPFADAAEIIQVVEQQMPLSGELRNCNGFIYLDVDDAYIHRLIDLIDLPGFEEPPYFGDGLVGAHISIFYQDDGIENVEELGQTFTFVPKECITVKPGKWEGVEEVYCLRVESPELDQLRAKYGGSKSHHPLHITIAVNYKSKN